MIELIWTDYTTPPNKIMLYASNLLAWLATVLSEKEEYRKIDYNGCMVVKDTKNLCSILVICGDPYSQKKVLNILQQPPTEFKEKYIARVPCEEPNPVNEKTEDEKDECNIEVSDET